MKPKAKITLMIGLFIIILVSSGIYLNNKLDPLLQQPGGFWLGQDVIGSNDSDTSSSVDQESESTEGNEKAGVKAGVQSAAKSNNSQLNSSRTGNESLVTDLQKKVGQPIEKIDLLKASMILMRKLSAEDISYLSKVAMQNSYSQEDYQHSQEILVNRLSADDINTLKKLGEKYGKDLKILNPDAKS